MKTYKAGKEIKEVYGAYGDIVIVELKFGNISESCLKFQVDLLTYSHHLRDYNHILSPTTTTTTSTNFTQSFQEKTTNQAPIKPSRATTSSSSTIFFQPVQVK
eukprot:GHVH01014109.1.p1 GENE.GHVH01014109.1~~GHVH01014109.1.p1  ORF type:complete len:103 (+),score=12.37 GHVH01014109.1:86-394(+)